MLRSTYTTPNAPSGNRRHISRASLPLVGTRAPRAGRRIRGFDPRRRNDRPDFARDRLLRVGANRHPEVEPSLPLRTSVSRQHRERVVRSLAAVFGVGGGHGRIAQLVRAPALHAGCRGFESLFAHRVSRGPCRLERGISVYRIGGKDRDENDLSAEAHVGCRSPCRWAHCARRALSAQTRTQEKLPRRDSAGSRRRLPFAREGHRHEPRRADPNQASERTSRSSRCTSFPRRPSAPISRLLASRATACRTRSRRDCSPPRSARIFYVDGNVTKTGTGYKADARLVLARDNSMVQPLPSISGNKLGDVASQISKAILDVAQAACPTSAPARRSSASGDRGRRDRRRQGRDHGLSAVDDRPRVSGERVAQAERARRTPSSPSHRRSSRSIRTAVPRSSCSATPTRQRSDLNHAVEAWTKSDRGVPEGCAARVHGREQDRTERPGRCREADHRCRGRFTIPAIPDLVHLKWLILLATKDCAGSDRRRASR